MFNFKNKNKKKDPKTLRYGCAWAGPGEDRMLIKFDVKSFFEGRQSITNIGKANNNMSFRVSGDAQIMKDILKSHGFVEHPYHSRFTNFSWIGNSISQLTVDGLRNYQTINHFVGSTHLTRKDKLYTNVSKLKKKGGTEKFDFLPETFILPRQTKQFKAHCKSNPGPYIVKPVGLSRGRGVYLINSDKDLVEEWKNDYQIVSKYINNPFMIDGYKTDLRVYVLVTSFDPLVVYMYQEGLTRFATVKYSKSVKHLNTLRMHLTNYSINASSGSYIKNEDSSIEDYGSKWTLSALMRHFRDKGLDTVALMSSLEDIVVKTLLSVENSLARKSTMYQRKATNCFEIFGFDIMLDENYKPWLLEVNLSPSLVCTTPLDIKVKSNMLCDLLNLVGVEAYHKTKPTDTGSFIQRFDNYYHRTVGYFCYCIMRDMCKKTIYGPWKYRRYLKLKSTYQPKSTMFGRRLQDRKRSRLLSKLTRSEQKLVTKTLNEETRAGGWVRVFPLRDSWKRYRHLLQYPTTTNMILHQRLYPDQHQQSLPPMKKPTTSLRKTDSEEELVKNCKAMQTKAFTVEDLEKVQRMKRYHTSLEVGPHPQFSVRTYTREYFRPKPLGDEASLDEDIMRRLFIQIERGRVFTELQARTAFMKYVTNIKQMLRDQGNPYVPNMTAVPPVGVVKDLLFQLLGQCSDLFIDPDATTPTRYTLDSCLTGFLYNYHQETRKLHTRSETLENADPIRKRLDQDQGEGNKTSDVVAPMFVTPGLFEDFIHLAYPWDLEHLLVTYVKVHGDVGIFMRNRIQNGTRCLGGGDEDTVKTRRDGRLWVPTNPDIGEVWTTV